MSILIKGIEMPKTCYDCWALDEYGDYPVCLITGEQRGYNFRTREKRMDMCPLIEVPTPHGRLIDAEAMENSFKKTYGVGISFKGVPTIIEAEESDTEESRG